MKYQSIVRRTTVSIIWSIILPNLYEYTFTIKLEIHLPDTQHLIDTEAIYPIISVLIIKSAI